MTSSCGIYKITNTITGDFYIGSACNLRQRWNGHRSGLVNNRHKNPHLQNAWNKYGGNSFEFSICELCEKKWLITREQFYIDNEKPAYNICQIAGSPLGRITTEEHKRKIGEANKGKHWSEEHRRKMSESAKRYRADKRLQLELAIAKVMADRRLQAATQ